MSNELKHILCIDDETDILDVAQMCLETVGNYKVTPLNSGVEAVDKIIEVKPDIVLLDVMMPVMDGPAVLKEIRKKPELNDIPVIFMTARVQPAEIDKYIEMGASGVIPKPFDPMALSSEVLAIWERSNVR